VQPLFPFVFLESRKDLCLQFILNESLNCFRSIQKMKNSYPEERMEVYSELITPEPEDFFSTSFGALEKLIYLSRLINQKKLANHFETLAQKTWNAYEEEELIAEEKFREDFQMITSDLLPLLLEERENENLLLFLLNNKEEIEHLFSSEWFQEIFSHSDSLKKNLMDNYKKRGFESIVLKIQQFHDTID